MLCSAVPVKIIHQNQAPSDISHFHYYSWKYDGKEGGGEGRKKREKKEENFEHYRNAFNFGNRLEEILFYVYEQHRWFVKRELRVSGNSTSNIFASFIVS